jgi:hypothetical protein
LFSGKPSSQVRTFLAGSGGRLADLVVEEAAGEGVAGGVRVCRVSVVLGFAEWYGEDFARTIFSEFWHEMVSDRGAPPIDLGRVV